MRLAVELVSVWTEGSGVILVLGSDGIRGFKDHLRPLKFSK